MIYRQIENKDCIRTLASGTLEKQYSMSFSDKWLHIATTLHCCCKQMRADVKQVWGAGMRVCLETVGRLSLGVSFRTIRQPLVERLGAVSFTSDNGAEDMFSQRVYCQHQQRDQITHTHTWSCFNGNFLIFQWQLCKLFLTALCGHAVQWWWQ